MDATHILLVFPWKAAAPRIHKTQNKTPNQIPKPKSSSSPKWTPEDKKESVQILNSTEESINQEKLAELPLVNPDDPRGWWNNHGTLTRAFMSFSFFPCSLVTTTRPAFRPPGWPPNWARHRPLLNDDDDDDVGKQSRCELLRVPPFVISGLPSGRWWATQAVSMVLVGTPSSSGAGRSISIATILLQRHPKLRHAERVFGSLGLSPVQFRSQRRSQFISPAGGSRWPMRCHSREPWVTTWRVHLISTQLAMISRLATWTNFY